MIRLNVVDAGRTLCRFTKPSTADVLSRLSPLPSTVVAEESRRVLHRIPQLTDDAIDDLCGALLIPRDNWPHVWPDAGAVLLDGVLDTLAAMIDIAPIVVLSNIPVTCGPSRMNDLMQQCEPYVSAIYTSYAERLRKPDPRLWERIAERHGTSTDHVVHYGDQFANDIQGAVSAGCRAVYVNTRNVDPPPSHEWLASPDRIGITDGLPAALSFVRREWSA